jgi:membrane protein
MLNLTRLTIRRAREERLAQVAGSLTFTTLLSLVPMLAVSFALFVRFPAFRELELAIERTLLAGMLPPEISRTVLRHLHQFAANAHKLTFAGSLFVLVAAVALLLTVENALNQIWQVRKPRPLPKRVGLYLLMLAVGPPAVGASLWAMSTLFGASIGLIGTLPPSIELALRFTPAALGALALAAVFRFVPNAKVPPLHALAGGALAGLALELGKRGFAAYLVKLPTYKAVYGAFATLPIFLLWLYFSWLVVLTAACITANLGRVARVRKPSQALLRARAS